MYLSGLYQSRTVYSLDSFLVHYELELLSMHDAAIYLVLYSINDEMTVIVL